MRADRGDTVPSSQLSTLTFKTKGRCHVSEEKCPEQTQIREKLVEVEKALEEVKRKILELLKLFK